MEKLHEARTRTSAPAGLMALAVVDNEIQQVWINATVSVVDGILSLSFNPVTAIENIIAITAITTIDGEKIDTLNNE